MIESTQAEPVLVEERVVSRIADLFARGNTFYGMDSNPFMKPVLPMSFNDSRSYDGILLISTCPLW
jgi:hypothetical protein